MTQPTTIAALTAANDHLRQKLATADAIIADAALTVQDVLTENRALRREIEFVEAMLQDEIHTSQVRAQRIAELELMLSATTKAQQVTIELLAK
jgi:hypothetical protein